MVRRGVANGEGWSCIVMVSSLRMRTKVMIQE